MKKIVYTLLTAIAAITLTACSEDENIVNELEGLKLVTTLSNADHTIELYTPHGVFQTGYNAIYLQIKNTDESSVTDATVSWKPVMHMHAMSHSCPASAVMKMENAKSTYAGFIIFQMAGNDMEYWELALDYDINGTAYTAEDRISVIAAPKRVVESFQATDGKRYLAALVEPHDPEVGINDITVALYQMESMMDFSVVDDLEIMIDPRMPGMGNHTSPNNVDLVQGDDTMYHGKLSLTMTGYWKINLRLMTATGDILKGEVVTDANESSSIFFELEF